MNEAQEERAPAARDPDALARAAREGSKAAFAALVRRFEEPLYNFVRVRVPAAEDAEELTQDAFLRAWERIDLYDPRRSFATWLFTVAARLTASRWRARRPRSVESSALDALGGGGVEPARAASEREEREGLWETAERALSRDQRSVLWLRYAEDLSTREIATITGRSEVGVRVLLFRARGRLAAALARGGDAPQPARGYPSRSPARPLLGGER